MKNKPILTSHCSCGQVSEWMWDEDDDEWAEYCCWRCSALFAMEFETQMSMQEYECFLISPEELLKQND